MRVLSIAGLALRRVGRDRTALFFLVVLPVVVIVVVGASVRGFATFRVGVVDLGAGVSGRDLSQALERAPGLEVRPMTTVAGASRAVAQGEIATAVILPAGMDTSLRSGRPVDIQLLAEESNSTQQAAAAQVTSVVMAQGSLVQAALFASSQAGAASATAGTGTGTGAGAGAGGDTYDANLARAAAAQARVPGVTVRRTVVDAKATILPQGFSYSAPTMLVLFVFLNALAGSAAVIQTRRLGMYERIAATPVPLAAVVAGETLGAVGISLVQSTLIVVVGTAAFGVSWGDPGAAAVLVALWALVSAGAGVLAGTLFRTPEQAGAIGPAAGIAFAMLGGCMWPLAVVNPAMRQVGHATPHAWAVDAWTALISRGGTLATIAPQLGVLAGFAAAFLVLATVRLRRSLS